MDQATVLPAITQVGAVTPMHMLQMAVQQNADLDKLEKLMALQERWEANEARKAFNAALGKFKAEGITVGKDNRVSYGEGSKATTYTHATLGNICNVLSPALSAHGLSFRWETKQVDGRIFVTCILSHDMGHSVSVSLDGGADTTGGKNNIQAIGSTISYLERYTLLAITGTSTADQDDDARSVEVESGTDRQQEGAQVECLSNARFEELCTDKPDPKDPGKILKMGWKSMVTSGAKSADDLIAWATTRGNLSESQQATIRGWERK